MNFIKELNIEYLSLDFKIPKESDCYKRHSDFVLRKIADIIQSRIESKENKIMINTNLKLGLPMENINKIAGPIVEAWAYEVFTDVLSNNQNIYKLINVESCERLNMSVCNTPV